MKTYHLKIVTAYYLLFITAAFLYCSRDKDTITGGSDSPVQPDTLVDRKPNIYIYPQETTSMRVTLSFPMGSRMTDSKPAYPDSGWQVTVEPSGLIDGTWPCLFYECTLPNYMQSDSGWCVEQNKLEDFFRTTLTGYGLTGPEIKDFLEYWLPILGESDYYLVFPQPEEIMGPLIELTFSQPPDTRLRLHFLFQGIDSYKTIKAPFIQSTERAGFTVIEWGGMLF